MPLKPGTMLGEYEIKSLLGVGGMGEVYLAYDANLQRDVAIKVLPEAFARDTERVARFRREATLLASLNHPNIAAIYRLEESGPAPSLVMEYVPGETLADRLHPSRARQQAVPSGIPSPVPLPVPLDEALEIAKQIADALEHAHEKPIIHRDLKPTNVKLTPEGKVKVLDFGLAKAFAGDGTASGSATPVINSNSPTLSKLPEGFREMSFSPTLPGVILGTAAYMSPEQARGKTVDKRTDIWALGCILFELLTGKQAFRGEDVTEILASVVKSDPEWNLLPAETPANVRFVLRRCLEKDRTRRFRDAADVRIQIEEIQAAPAAAPTPAVAIPPLPTWRRWLPWAAAVALSVVTGLVVWNLRRAPAEAQPVQFSIGPPEKGVFASQTGFLAVSPDGTKVAFAAVGSSGKVQLWIRPLDSQTPQPLPGTDNVNGYSPFWSPDSRFLGFVADGKLKKITVAGGPAQTLTEASANSSGTWSRDGVILFVPGAGSLIYRVSAAGGAATPLTTLDASRQETGHYNPYFLPDGKHFLFLARSSNAAKHAILVGSLDSKETKLLVNTSSHPVYVPPGYLLFYREGTLMAQGFDAGRLELTGEAVPIAEAIQFNAGNGRAAFAASDNGVLLYRAGLGIAAQFTWVDRAGKELSRLGEVPDSHFSLSRDEKHVAFDLPSPSANDLYLFDLARGSSSRFTFSLASTVGSRGRPVVWTPDGNRTVFDGATADGTMGLFQKPANGAGQPELLLKAPGSSVMDLSRDGRFLLYQQTDPITKYDMWVLPMSGDKQPKPFLQTQFDEGHAQFSPDGHWVAYTSNESGRPEVYVQPFPGPGGKWQVSTGGGMLPLWRADGKELFYMYQGKLMSVEVRVGAQFEAGSPQELFEPQVGLTHGMEAGNHYAVSADGKRFLIIRAKEGTQAFPITVVLNWPALLKK